MKGKNFKFMDFNNILWTFVIFRKRKTDFTPLKFPKKIWTFLIFLMDLTNFYTYNINWAGKESFLHMFGLL